MRDFDHAIHCLTRFREIGLHLAVDDFGTGYSSLSYLKHFPIDLLKIDRSFISGLPDCRDDAAIVTAIVAMGHGLGLKVMAEGVETAAQERFLTELGCVAFQGYHYGRPLTAEAFTRLLRTPRVAHG
jgi:EAL domain-containing protein (putative c-di-GMP-specific phosphodiesterase class I)